LGRFHRPITFRCAGDGVQAEIGSTGEAGVIANSRTLPLPDPNPWFSRRHSRRTRRERKDHCPDPVNADPDLIDAVKTAAARLEDCERRLVFAA
jgi:hypothetical protein